MCNQGPQGSLQRQPCRHIQLKAAVRIDAQQQSQGGNLSRQWIDRIATFMQTASDARRVNGWAAADMGGRSLQVALQRLGLLAQRHRRGSRNRSFVRGDRLDKRVGGSDHVLDLVPLDRRLQRCGGSGRVQMSVAPPSHAAFPVIQAGRHPRRHFRGLLRLHSRYGPPDCSTAQGGLCRKASIRRSPGQIACQRPDQPTTLWVEPTSTGEPRLRGAPNKKG